MAIKGAQNKVAKFMQPVLERAEEKALPGRIFGGRRKTPRRERPGGAFEGYGSRREGASSPSETTEPTKASERAMDLEDLTSPAGCLIDFFKKSRSFLAAGRLSGRPVRGYDSL